MATITVEIGKKGKKGTRSLNFLVCSGKTKRRIPLDVCLAESDVSANGKKIINVAKARAVEDMRRKLEDKLFTISLELLGTGETDASYIVERLTARTGEPDFFEFAEEWLERTEIKGVKNYKSMLSSLERHLGKRRLPFSLITYSMLQKYSDSLKDTPRAQSLYLGSVRHLYRQAMKQLNTDYDKTIKNDPFTRFDVPRQQMKKGVRALSVEELAKVFGFQGKAGGRAQMARDVFILSFCLMGMNSVDIYECKDCTNGTLRYNRTKTKGRRSDAAYIEVKIHPCISALMKKYKGTSRVFCFDERYSDASSFNKNLNKGLKEVGKNIGIPNLQFYQARHTFATLSRNLMKFSKSDVDEALNHVGTMDIADVYIKKDFSIINENNFKLLDEVLKTTGKI